MKKITKLLLSLLCFITLAACSNNSSKDEKVLKVAATAQPHAEILEYAAPILKDKYDITLKITVLDDYYVFNKSLNEGEIDANYFQHQPFFDQEVADNGYEISNVGGIHIEPFGFYSKKVSSISELTVDSKIIISNSVTDHGRILSILEKAGLISLKAGVNAQSATIEDITSNPLNFEFVEIKPELLTVAYENNEGDLVAINGNYAIQAGLNPTKDAVILEQADQDNPYVNIVACKKGHENDEGIKALVEVLQSDDVRNFITSTYNDGSVIPATK